VVGGSQVINVLIGIIRTKFMAVLLGPAGIGLMGMYQALTAMVGTVTGLGIGSSGVRQIAEASGTDDQQKIARSIITLRRASLFLGLFGMAATIVLSGFLSRLAFGAAEHEMALAVLGLTLLFGAVSGGQIALVQGMRRIGDLATLSVLGALLSSSISIPLIYIWGESGIVPALVVTSAMTMFTSWWFARKIPLDRIPLSWKETLMEGKGLVALGLAFMASSVMASSIMFLIRALLVRKVGLDGVGLYQAAYTLSSLYIGVILNAMGMDFYPRLTAVAQDNAACNRLVNEQTEVGLLVAIPGIVITLVLAPLVIELFYSSKFIPAYEVLRWQILGVFLRVVSWPMAFIQLAKGRGKLFFFTELFGNLAHVGFIWAGIGFYGLPGTGMAFFAQYVFYTVLMIGVARVLSDFGWSSANAKLILGASVWVAATFALPAFASRTMALLLGLLMSAAAAAYCLRNLYTLVGPKWFGDFVAKFRYRLGWKKP